MQRPMHSMLPLGKGISRIAYGANKAQAVYDTVCGREAFHHFVAKLI